MANKALFCSFYVSFCAFCAFLWLKNPFNQRNPQSAIRNTNYYVRNYKPFYAKRTQFPKSQMNVTSVNTMDYEIRTLGERGKNEPKTNPTCPCVAFGEAGTNPISKGVSTREPDVAQLLAHGTFSTDIRPGRAL